LNPTLETAILELAGAWGGPPATGRWRTSPEDFQVREIPLLEPDGEGEHSWLLIRKRGENTEQVARQLAGHAGVPARDVSYAGLKDRNAVTEQWFSVHLPGRQEPDWGALETGSVTVLRQARHHRKLRRGTLRGNAFRLVIRELSGETDVLQRRLETVARHGVPNYFGEQRFGRGGSNLWKVEQLFSQRGRRLSRHQRGLVLSAARAFLFNQVLDRRVRDGNWNRVLSGDALQLAGSHSYFIAPAADAELQARADALDLHPTGPLWGRGDSPVGAASRELEEQVLEAHGPWLQGLSAAGLGQDRRALRLVVEDLHWAWPTPDAVVLEFKLAAGCYATSVLRELVARQGGAR
jgi:tRNA pseudouridine13 synthase